MGEKERLENRCVKYISEKGITHFSELYRALKISKSKFYNYGLHNSKKILGAIERSESEKTEFEKTSKKVFFEENVRSFHEIQAKLFCFKAFKQKNYEKMKAEAKKIIDRQIALLEWVLKISDKEQA